MSLTRIRKDILELKQIAALEKKPAEDDRIKNMTAEELQQAINDEFAKLGFKSEEDLFDAAKRYFAENGLKTSFSNEYQLREYIFENDERFANIVLMYGNFGGSE